MKAAPCVPALCGGKPTDLAAGTASHRLNFFAARLNGTENPPKRPGIRRMSVYVGTETSIIDIIYIGDPTHIHCAIIRSALTAVRPVAHSAQAEVVRPNGPESRSE